MTPWHHGPSKALKDGKTWSKGQPQLSPQRQTENGSFYTANAAGLPFELHYRWAEKTSLAGRWLGS